MNDAIVQSLEIVTLLGAASVPDVVFDESLALAPCLVAADGGAARALARGRMPEAVIGDFDSLSDEVRAQIPAERLHRVTEQECTDFDKAIRGIVAPLILAVGFTGQRLDHELAVYNALVRNGDRRVIVVGEHDICFHLPAPLRLELPLGSRVSLFPMARVGCDSTGLEWPTDGLDFCPWGRVGTSNRSVSEVVDLWPEGPGMLLILPRAQLRAAMRALVDGSAPVRDR